MDESENEIVRHEAASSYSAISEKKDFLKNIMSDKSRIVRESAMVSLEMIDFWKND